MPVIETSIVNIIVFVVGTKGKFAKLKPELMQFRRYSFIEIVNSHAWNVKYKCGVAANTIMTSGNIGKHCKAVSERLGNDVHNNVFPFICNANRVAVASLNP